MDGRARALQGGRMMNLKDTNKIIERLAEVKASIDPEVHSNVGAIKYGIAIAIKEIGNAPTIEAESVRHGEWIDKGYSGDWAWQTDGRGNSWRVFQCSACYEKSKSKSKHCPNCGAKMDGKSRAL